MTFEIRENGEEETVGQGEKLQGSKERDLKKVKVVRKVYIEVVLVEVFRFKNNRRRRVVAYETTLFVLLLSTKHTSSLVVSKGHFLTYYSSNPKHLVHQN